MRSFTSLLILVSLLSACQVGPTISPTPTGQADPTPGVLSPSATYSPTRTPLSLSTPTSSSKIPVNAADLRGVRVELWHPWTGSLSNTIDSVVAEFNQSNIWGITVQALSQGSDSGVEDALNALESPAAQSLVIVAPPEAIAFDQAKSNDIVELSPYVSDPLWGLSPEEAADFIPSFWADSLANGKQFSIPLVRNLAVLFYNQSWAQALGFQNPPLSSVDFQSQACAAAKANLVSGGTDNAGTGGYLVNTSETAILSWLSAFENLPASNQPGPFSFNNSQSGAALAYLRALFDKNCAWSGRSPTSYVYFAQRKALFYSATLEDIPFQQKAMAQQKNSDVWAILPYPGESSQPAPIAFGPSLAIVNARPNEQLAAWLFLRWFILPRNQAKLAAAGSLLPVSKSSLEMMAPTKTQSPKWAQAAGWIEQAQPAFSGAWWYTARPVVEDAAWQIFQPFTKPASIPDILKELDSTVNELLQH